MPLQLLAEDFQSEPFVLGAGQRVAQFRVRLCRLKKRSRLPDPKIRVVELPLQRVEGGAKLHHPAYDFNDAALPYGISYWVELVETALAP